MNHPTNLELLRLATELVFSDYNNRRANLHNQWLVDNDKMKRMYGTSVPYPTIPPYPTAEEIVDKAQTLIQFLSAARPDIEKKETQKAVKELITEVSEKKESIKVENVDENSNTTLNNSITEQPNETESDKDIVEEKSVSNNIPEEEPSTKKSSVIDRIKNVWR